MTRDKAQKRAIRARMAKTGERYTTARHFTLDLHRSHEPSEVPNGLTGGDSPTTDQHALSPELVHAVADSRALPPREAEPEVSDAAVLRATGRDWDTWFALLDAWGAARRTHAEIARYVQETFDVGGWWAQTVTVGYERARGLRAVHQNARGFSVGVSKTFPVPVERLFTAFVDEERRAGWLEDIHLRHRTSRPHTSARFDVLPGETRLNATFISRGPEKATVQLQHERLADAGEVEHWRAFWKASLTRLMADGG